jgi:hypothetical protein
MSSLKVSGNKKQDKPIFTQMGQLKDINGQLLPKVPNMVGNCVAWHRRKMMPLKTIYLCPMYYEVFRTWFKRLCLEREADLQEQLLTWDGVEIVMMGTHHILKSNTGNDMFDWDYYETKKKEIN